MSGFGARKAVTPAITCGVCRRTERGPVLPPGWQEIELRHGATKELETIRVACGERCLTTTWRRLNMIDPTPQELNAIREAGYAAGEYLESIGQTDLAKLSDGEWMTLLQVVIGSYNPPRITEDDCPF